MHCCLSPSLSLYLYRLYIFISMLKLAWLHEIDEYTWNSLLPCRFKLTDWLLWQQLRNELRRIQAHITIMPWQESNPGKRVDDVCRTDPDLNIYYRHHFKMKPRKETHHCFAPQPQPFKCLHLPECTNIGLNFSFSCKTLQLQTHR